MLLSLSIRDFVLIEKLDLTFTSGSESGLGALTGETGAGKSILIDALGLGNRADSGAVRRGAQHPVAEGNDQPGFLRGEPRALGWHLLVGIPRKDPLQELAAVGMPGDEDGLT